MTLERTLDRARRRDCELAYRRTLHLDPQPRRRVQSAPARASSDHLDRPSSSTNSAFNSSLRRSGRRPKSAYVTTQTQRLSSAYTPVHHEPLPVGLGGSTLKTMLRKHPQLKDKLRPVAEHERIDEERLKRRQRQRAYERWLRTKKTPKAETPFEKRLALLKSESEQRKSKSQAAFDDWKQRKDEEIKMRKQAKLLERNRQQRKAQQRQATPEEQRYTIDGDVYCDVPMVEQFGGHYQ